MRTPSSKLSVGKILRRNEKQNRQAANSLKFCSKNLCRDEKQKRQAPKKCLPSVLFFSLKHQLVKRGKVLRVKLSAGMKNVCCQVVKPSFAWPIWLQLTDGTICRAGIRSDPLSTDKLLMRERRYARPPPPDLTYSFC